MAGGILRHHLQDATDESRGWNFSMTGQRLAGTNDSFSQASVRREENSRWKTPHLTQVPSPDHEQEHHRKKHNAKQARAPAAESTPSRPGPAARHENTR